MTNFADRLLAGDDAALDVLAGGLLIPERNNLVERPWGGTRLREFKRLHPLPDQYELTGQGFGEAFEIAACDADAEARQYPSRLRFEDGSRLSLPVLLARHGPRLLGDAFLRRYGACYPLLPKILDVKELLSVQGHPPGHTEVYVIMEAEPGASLRLGFRCDMDRGALVDKLEHGRARQEWLAGQLTAGREPGELQTLLAPWFAQRESDVAAVATRFDELFAGGASHTELVACLTGLKQLYWDVLDSLNAIPVTAGQVILNETPSRFLAPGALPSAEVHALGNPERREVLALEVRLPGPTFRAWDNVRFPVRPIDVRAAVDALNLRATSAVDFIMQPVPVAGTTGVFVSVDTPFFRIEHLRPAAGDPIVVDSGGAHSLHVLHGEVAVTMQTGTAQRLQRGESAIVPAPIQRYTVSAQADAELLRVTLPTTLV